ncbi:hypothetical protein BDR26DRAFT_866209 [Obelidium mucronatum]|nr:hypothetical protein BDR26DRAFT_866209 [Obelidium mucronatum]
MGSITNPISQPQLVLFGIVFGLTFQVAMLGLFSSLSRWVQSTSHHFWKVGTIMVLFNTVAIIFTALFYFNLFTNEEVCGITSFCINLFSHFFFLLFNCFMLYKCYVTSSFRRIVLAGIIVLLIHRIGWAVIDLVKSGGSWNPESKACDYIQNPMTGLGYNLADVGDDNRPFLFHCGYWIQHQKLFFKTFKTCRYPCP